MTERHQAMALEVLQGLNRAKDPVEAIDAILRIVKQYSGVEAVGIRYQDGDDYPYFVWDGFSEEHILQENRLCSYDQEGRLLRGGDGRPVLECMCGNIIRGRFDPSKPFFTEGGSFWTNSTTELLASTTEEDRQARTRNKCNEEGYESVALIPLRGDEGNIGLLQLNDRRRDRFSLEMIQFLEGLGESIGIAIARLTDDRERKKILHDYGERIKELNCLYGISKLVEKSDLSLEEILQGIVELVPPAWQYPDITCARISIDNQEFKTKKFKESRWRLSSKVKVYGKILGSVEVYYSEEVPERYEGSFLKGERDLLNAIAERLCGIIERKRAEEWLRTLDKYALMLNEEEVRHLRALVSEDLEFNASYRDVMVDSMEEIRDEEVRLLLEDMIQTLNLDLRLIEKLENLLK